MGDLHSQGRAPFTVRQNKLPGGKMPIPGNHLDNHVPWLDEARKLIGISEIPGINDEPEVMALYKEVGHTWVEHDEVPWCAAAVGAILKRSGMSYLKSLRARDYESYGVELEGPINGCIVTFWRDSKTSGKGHVGFYGGVENGKVWVLGGNQSNSFCWKQYSKDQVTGYRWPLVADEVRKPTPPSSEIRIPRLDAPGVSFQGQVSNHRRKGANQASSSASAQQAQVNSHSTAHPNPNPQPQNRSLLDFTGHNWKTTTGAVIYLAGWIGEVMGLPLVPDTVSYSFGPTLQQAGALLAGTGAIHKIDRAVKIMRPLARFAAARS